MRTAWLIVIALGWGSAVAQNLVPNSGFEILDSCPDNLSQIEAAPPWQTFRGSVDLFNACAQEGDVSVPLNGFGFQYPYDGNGYAGLISYIPGDSLQREFIGCELITPLTPGEPVYISFRLAVGGWGLFAPQPNQSASGIGVFFSTVPFQHINEDVPLPTWAALSIDAAPVDTTEWILLSGEYVPDSAYTQIVLGNLRSQSQLEVILLDSSNNGSFGAYIFLDDVCVSLTPGYCPMTTGISTEAERSKLTVWPNPCTADISMKARQGRDSDLSSYALFDARGLLVEEGGLNWAGDMVTIASTDWPEGVLCLVAYDHVGPQARFTVVHLNP